MWRLLSCLVLCWAVAGCSNGLVSAPRGVTAQGDATYEDAEQIDDPTRELTSKPEPALARIALGSRADVNLSPAVWNAVSAIYPDLFIFAGDVISRDVGASGSQADIGDLIALHDAYAGFASLDGFLQLKGSAPLLAMRYDEGAGRTDQPPDAGFDQISKQIFLDFWQAAETDPRRAQGGLYFSKSYGPADSRVQVIVLDVLSLRGLDADTIASNDSKLTADPFTLLGSAQWKWLEEELQKPAELRLIVSSIEVLSESKTADGWARFPTERARLLKLALGANGRTVLLSGNDRHGVIYRYQTGSFFPLYELSPSSLVKRSNRRREIGSHVLFRPLMLSNFGAIEIDWAEREIFLEITDETGAKFRSMRVPLAIRLTS